MYAPTIDELTTMSDTDRQLIDDTGLPLIDDAGLLLIDDTGLLLIDEFDSWSIGELTAFMSHICCAPDPSVPEEPADA